MPKNTRLKNASILSLLSMNALAQQTETLSPIDVFARAYDGAKSEFEQIGETNRPEWTSKRRFATTRSYIQKDPWEIGVEQWFRNRTYDGKDSKQLFVEEIEIGLPHRMQLDLYYDWVHENEKTQSKDFAVELRYAFADWGVIPLNPTIYGEYKFDAGAAGTDVYEFKLLLSEDISNKWQWAMNFSYEQEIDGEKNTELAISQGIAYSIMDQKLSAGLEMTYKNETVAGARSDAENKFNIGPSIQYRPTPNTHIDAVCTIGCTNDSPVTESFLIFGWDIGAPAAGKSNKHYKPVGNMRD